MTSPRIMAMMLTADRSEMTQRAVECFWMSHYDNKRLLIYDTGKEPVKLDNFEHVYHEHRPEDSGLTIGALRNLAIAFAHPLCLNADIIVHFDSDDYSHPNRIAEQVALLQASRADCVGYNELLFWRDGNAPHAIGEEPDTWDGEQAWLYSNRSSSYALGTSLCYWRKTWEKKPFADTSSGEDLRFIEGLKVVACTGTKAIKIQRNNRHGLLWVNSATDEEPRMVARIHGGNTHCRIVDQSHEPEHLRQWKRVPEWDSRLRSIMAL